MVHYDARTGIVNYQNGPPIDHPRFMALMTDASLEVIHYDDGYPTESLRVKELKLIDKPDISLTVTVFVASQNAKALVTRTRTTPLQHRYYPVEPKPVD